MRALCTLPNVTERAAGPSARPCRLGEGPWGTRGGRGIGSSGRLPSLSMTVLPRCAVRAAWRAELPWALLTRSFSTTRLAPQASPASGVPNGPYHIFDREVKRDQRSRAALRRPVDESGTAFLPESHRGEVSRLTDYVWEAGAESLAERLQVRHAADARTSSARSRWSSSSAPVLAISGATLTRPAPASRS